MNCECLSLGEEALVPMKGSLLSTQGGGTYVTKEKGSTCLSTDKSADTYLAEQSGRQL